MRTLLLVIASSVAAYVIADVLALWIVTANFDWICTPDGSWTVCYYAPKK